LRNEPLAVQIRLGVYHHAGSKDAKAACES
jgi:hypothetical protein